MKRGLLWFLCVLLTLTLVLPAFADSIAIPREGGPGNPGSAPREAGEKGVPGPLVIALICAVVIVAAAVLTWAILKRRRGKKV